MIQLGLLDWWQCGRGLCVGVGCFMGICIANKGWSMRCGYLFHDASCPRVAYPKKSEYERNLGLLLKHHCYTSSWILFVLGSPLTIETEIRQEVHRAETKFWEVTPALSKLAKIRLVFIKNILALLVHARKSWEY